MKIHLKSFPARKRFFDRKPLSAWKRFLARSAFTAVAAILLLAAGCAANQLNVAAKSIITAQELYDSTMRASADAHAQGLIDDEARARIIVIGNMAHDSIALAQAALVTCLDAGTAENQSKLAAALLAVKGNLGRLVETAVNFGVNLSGAVNNYHGGGGKDE